MGTRALLDHLLDGAPAEVVHDALLQVLRAGAARDGTAIWHPLGFARIVLRADPDAVLRLHVWPAEPPDVEFAVEPVHDHTWRLHSRVLCGHVTNHVLAAREGPGDHVLATVDRIDRLTDIVRPTDRPVAVETVDVRTVPAGERYELEPRMLHRSVPAPGAVVATIVAAQRVFAGTSRTLLPIGSHSVTIRRRDCTRAEVDHLIGSITIR